MTETIYQVFVTILALSLVASGFRRLLKTDSNTFRLVRWGFSALTIAATALAWCTWISPGAVQWAWMALLSAIVWVQSVTAAHWNQGVPDRFQQCAIPDFPEINQKASSMARTNAILYPIVESGRELGEILHQ